MKISNRLHRNLLLLSLFIAAPPLFALSDTSDTEYGLAVGWRKDSLDWNIASDLTGTATPNILSELTWDPLNMLQIEGHIDQQLSKHWLLLIDGHYALIYRGNNQDSDYFGNNRTTEFSRSNNAANGGDLYGFNLAVGFRLGMQPRLKSASVGLIPHLGWGVTRLRVELTDGNQTVATAGITPSLGPFPGLNSSYDTKWQGAFAGIKFYYDSGYYTRLSLQLRQHYLDYDAEANWNLRSDFAHPVSFAHEAKGKASTLTLSLDYDLSGEWTARLSMSRERWETDPGIDTVFFANGTTTQTRLNVVNWESSSIMLGVFYSY